MTNPVSDSEVATLLTGLTGGIDPLAITLVRKVEENLSNFSEVPDLAHFVCVSETPDDKLLESLGDDFYRFSGCARVSRDETREPSAVALSVWEPFFMAYPRALSEDGQVHMSLLKITRRTRFVFNEEDFWHLNENVLSGDSDTDTFMGIEANIADARVRGDSVADVVLWKAVTYFVEGDDTWNGGGLYPLGAPGTITIPGESVFLTLKLACHDSDANLSEIMSPYLCSDFPRHSDLGMLIDESNWGNAGYYYALDNLASRIVHIMLLRFMKFDRQGLPGYYDYFFDSHDDMEFDLVIPGRPWDNAFWRRLQAHEEYTHHYDGSESRWESYSLEPLSSEAFL